MEEEDHEKKKNEKGIGRIVWLGSRHLFLLLNVVYVYRQG